MRISLRERLRQLYVFRCGYCGVSERDTGALLTTDHFQPRSQGGPTTFSNLVYACHTCNIYKGDWWEPSSERHILHPLNDRLAEHYVEEASGLLRPLTPTGRFHIERLNLNRLPLVAQRLERAVQISRAARETEMLTRLDTLEAEVALLKRELGQLEA